MKKLFIFIVCTMFILTNCGESSQDNVKNETANIGEKNTAVVSGSNINEEDLRQLEEKLLQAEKKIEELTVEVEGWKKREESWIDFEKYMSEAINEHQKILQNTYELVSERLGEEEAYRLFGFFDPEKVKVGMQIGDLTVEEISLEKEGDYLKSYTVIYDGELKLNGSITIDRELPMNSIPGGGYYFYVNNEQLHKVPHTVDDLRYGKRRFMIYNYEDLEEAIGRELPSGEVMELKAVFTDFASDFIFESHPFEVVKFVELVED